MILCPLPTQYLRLQAFLQPVRISVVIPCFNAAKYLPATLRSVLAQEMPDIEIIVVDDGSSDGSAELLMRDFPAVRLIRQHNQGVSAARNTGIHAASHDWIAFVDADDLWLPGKLIAQEQALVSAPGVRMAYTAWQVWNSEQPEPSRQDLERLLLGAEDPSRWAGPSGWLYKELLLDCVVWTSTVLVHRSVLDEAGLFDIGLRIGEDLDLWLRASRLTPVLRVPRPLALYRMHGANTTRRVPETNHQGEVVLRALQRWGLDSPDGSSARAADVRHALAQSWSDYAASHLTDGSIVRAGQGARMSIRTDPSYLPGWVLLAKSLTRQVWHRRLRSG